MEYLWRYWPLCSLIPGSTGVKDYNGLPFFEGDEDRIGVPGSSSGFLVVAAAGALNSFAKAFVIIMFELIN